MALKEGDLKDVVLKKISIDEFEPKTGDAKMFQYQVFRLPKVMLVTTYMVF